MSSDMTKAEAFEIAKKRWSELSESAKKPYRDNAMKDTEKFYEKTKKFSDVKKKLEQGQQLTDRSEPEAITQKKLVTITASPSPLKAKIGKSPLDKLVIKPSKALTAMAAFVQQKAPVMMKADSISHKEAAKKLELVWNDLDEDDKMPYRKIAELDKIRFDNEVQNLNLSPSVAKRPIHQPAEPLKAIKPKKAKVAFMFYVSAESGKLVKEKGLSSAAGAIKILGANW